MDHRTFKLAWPLLALACVDCIVLVHPMVAQTPQVADSRLGVDVLKLTNGKRLYGFVLSENADRSLQFAVERPWLMGTHPELHQEYLALESEQIKQARQQLLERIDKWMIARADDALLLRFLKSQREKINDAPEQADSHSLFMVLQISRDLVREVLVQKPEQRKIAGLAYQHRLEKIITTPATLLEKQLELQGVDVTSEQVNLSADVPKVLSESERAWATRKALVEFMYRQPLEYQGTGSTLVKKGEQPDPSALIRQMLGDSGMNSISQLGAELGLPEFRASSQEPSDWWQSVTRKAEGEGYLGVLITRLKQNLLSPEVRVETTLFVQESPGQWFAALEFRSSADADTQPADRMARIREDPQIKGLLDSLSSLGLDVGDRLDQALRHGAATEQAMAEASRQFTQFLDEYTQALDGAPVPVR